MSRNIYIVFEILGIHKDYINSCRYYKFPTEKNLSHSALSFQVHHLEINSEGPYTSRMYKDHQIWLRKHSQRIWDPRLYSSNVTFVLFRPSILDPLSQQGYTSLWPRPDAQRLCKPKTHSFSSSDHKWWPDKTAEQSFEKCHHLTLAQNFLLLDTIQHNWSLTFMKYYCRFIIYLLGAILFYKQHLYKPF